MARFRVRAFLPDRTPVIVRVDAQNTYEAATLAGKQVSEMKLDDGSTINTATLTDLSVKKLGDSKSAVYIGQKPKPRDKKSPAAVKPAATQPAAAAKPAAAKTK